MLDSGQLMFMYKVFSNSKKIDLKRGRRKKKKNASWKLCVFFISMERVTHDIRCVPI